MVYRVETSLKDLYSQKNFNNNQKYRNYKQKRICCSSTKYK